jgi:hypothetical protein
VVAAPVGRPPGSSWPGVRGAGSWEGGWGRGGVVVMFVFWGGVGSGFGFPRVPRQVVIMRHTSRVIDT